MKTITYDDTLYQLVPKNATHEMCLAAHDGPNCGAEYEMRASDREYWEACYLAMLSAAPTPPAQPAERKPQAGAGTRAVWPEKVANTVLDTPEPDEWIDGEPRPLPVFHMATLMKYGERCAEAGMSTITPDVNITFLAKADQANTKSAMKQAVERFLGWRLPQDFAPDCGISFDGRKDDEWNKNKTWPTGTNLFTAEQAKQMLEYVLSAIPTAEPAEKRLLTREQLKAVAICLESGRVSISEVQRKMGISWLAANELCQSIVDAGLVNGLELSPQLLAHGIKG